MSAKPWGSEPYTRAGGDCLCFECGKEFWRHPREKGPGYGFSGDEVITLHRLCDGRLVKL